MVDRTLRPVVPTEHHNEREHRRMLAVRASASLPKDGTEGMSAPLRLASYATADLPPAAEYAFSIAYDTTTNTIKFSNGTTWAAI